jgi:hypothetical protein
VAGSERSPGEMTSAANKSLPADQQAASRMSSVAPETAGELRSIFGALHPTGPRWSIVEFKSTRVLVHAQKWSSAHLLVPLRPPHMINCGTRPSHGGAQSTAANLQTPPPFHSRPPSARRLAARNRGRWSARSRASGQALPEVEIAATTGRKPATAHPALSYSE